MRILFASLRLAYPPDHGFAMRSWAVVEALAACGHRVTVQAFGDARPGAPAPAGCRVLPPVPLAGNSLSGSLALGGRALALARREPYNATRFASAAMRRRIAALVAGDGFDAVLADGAQSVVNLPVALDCPLILNAHNVEYVLVSRYAACESRVLRRAYAALESRRLRAWEMEVWRRADLVLACSDHDRDAVARFAPATACVVAPNVVDTAAYAPGLETEIESGLMLYTGGMDWLPNRDAVEFFLASILPAVRRGAPQARLAVAGRRGPAEWECRLAAAGVERLADVPDMRPVLRRAALCLVPLRIGSGTRLKILEAGAMAKAVVSTRLGAEGLALQDDRELLLADAPREFAAAVVRVLNSGSLRGRLGRAVRRRVVAAYGRAALAAALAPIEESWGVWSGRPRGARRGRAA